MVTCNFVLLCCSTKNLHVGRLGIGLGVTLGGGVTMGGGIVGFLQGAARGFGSGGGEVTEM